MKLLKKLTALTLSLLMAAFSAVTAFADGPEQLEVNGRHYGWKTGYCVLFLIDADGSVVLPLDDENGDNAADPVKYIKKLPTLEYLGTQKTDDAQEKKLYDCGNGSILAVWEADVIHYASGKSLIKEYPDAVFYEGTLFCLSGFVVIDGKTYYQDENGEKVRGWQDIGALKAYFNKKGEMVKGRTLVIGGIRYKFNKEGYLVGKYTGFTKSSKGRKYWKDGVLVKNAEFETESGKKYRADEKGYAARIKSSP